MAKTARIQPHFEAALEDIFGVARIYGVGKPIRELAEENPGLSLSTLKTIAKGRHIRPAQFLRIKEALRARPLDWIETKICYVEQYLNEYLVRLSDFDAESNVDRARVTEFFDKREEHKKEYPSRKDRFRWYVEYDFSRQGLSPKDVCDPVGKTGKKDIHSISYPTVTALRRGEHAWPRKFNLICRRLGIEKDERSVAKILYAEAFLGEHLLGDDPAAFSRLNRVHYPRTCDLLIFSTRECEILP